MNCVHVNVSGGERLGEVREGETSALVHRRHQRELRGPVQGQGDGRETEGRGALLHRQGASLYL